MAGPIQFVIITGMSGAGKSYAIKCFEDMGFFCVDNLPTTLIPTFADLVARSTHTADRVALGVDVREGEYLTHLLDTLQEATKAKVFRHLKFIVRGGGGILRKDDTGNPIVITNPPTDDRRLSQFHPTSPG